MLKSIVLFLVVTLTCILCMIGCKDCVEGMVEGKTVTPSKVNLTFSNGETLYATRQDSCEFVNWINFTLLGTPDTFLYSSYIALPEVLEDKLNLYFMIYGYDLFDNTSSSADDYNVLWQNIQSNDANQINKAPYKMNFFIEYYDDEGTRYRNTNNGSLNAGFSTPYSTDQGNLLLTAVSFTETDFNVVCDDNNRTIRMQADLSGIIFDQFNTDTIGVEGSIDINLGGYIY